MGSSINTITSRIDQQLNLNTIEESDHDTLSDYDELFLMYLQEII